MTSKIPTSIFFLVIIIILLEILVLMPRKNDLPVEQIDNAEFSRADLRIQGFKLVESVSPQKYWTLNADNALMFRENSVGILSRLDGEFVSQGSRYLKMYGKRGFLFINNKTLLLSDDVEALTEDGYKLTSTYLFYDNSTQVLRTAAPIKFDGPNPSIPEFSLTGQGLESNIKSHEHTIFQNVFAKRVYPGESPLTISAASGTVMENKQLADFSGNVIVEKGDLKISSDHFSVKYLASRKVDWASSTGNVHLWEDGWEGTCGEAILRDNNRLVELRGDVRMRRKSDVVTGELVTFDRTRKRMIVKKIEADFSIRRKK